MEKLYVKLCAEIKKIMTADVLIQMHTGTRAYCDFIEKHGPDCIGKNLAKVAKFYPIEWDDEDKSKYLIDIFSSTRDCNAALNACGIRWPRNESEDDMCQELKTLKEMMERANIDNNKRKAALKLQGAEGRAAANKIREYIWNCDIDYPNDLVRLVRNLWKHFSTYPHYIKVTNSPSSLHAKQGVNID